MTGWMRHAGLAVAPAAWAVNTQAGQILPYVDCARHVGSVSIASAVACAVALAAAALSLSGRRGLAGTDRFLAGLGGLVGLVFALALLLQSAATLILDPCAR